jgi:uncharacterized membrane protein
VRLRIVLGLMVVMLGLGTERADARFRVCNQMDQRLSVAFGYVDRTRGWTAQGWWVIETKQCTNIYEPDLDNRYYYVFAQPTAAGTPLQGGTVPFCIQGKSFLLYQEQYGKSTPEDCAKAGLQSVPFISIDVGQGQPNHVLNLTGTTNASASTAPAPPPQPPNYPPPQPPIAQVPRPAPPAGGGGGGGTSCQRYPNLC